MVESYEWPPEYCKPMLALPPLPPPEFVATEGMALDLDHLQ